MKLELQKKAGPLKRWQWAVAIIGLMLIYRYLRGGSGGAAQDTTAGASALPQPLSDLAPADPVPPDPTPTPIPTPVPVVHHHHTGGGGGGGGGSSSGPTPSPSPTPTQAPSAPTAQVSAPTPMAAVLASLKPPTDGGAAVRASLASLKPPTGPVSLAAPIRYYTYKVDVPLKAGQSLHFTSGRGYYAA